MGSMAARCLHNCQHSSLHLNSLHSLRVLGMPDVLFTFHMMPIKHSDPPINSDKRVVMHRNFHSYFSSPSAMNHIKCLGEKTWLTNIQFLLCFPFNDFHFSFFFFHYITLHKLFCFWTYFVYIIWMIWIQFMKTDVKTKTWLTYRHV